MSDTVSLPTEAQWALAAVSPIPPEDWLDQAVLGTPLLDSIARVASRSPNDPALVDGSRTLTYRELLEQVRALGQRIAALPAPPGPVAVLVGCDTDSVIALLAPLAAARPCFPLDNTQPPERLNAMIAQARAPIIVTAQAGGSSVTRNADVGAVPSTEGVGWGLDVPAVILPTSGSTGQPRLIVHSQRTIAYRGLMRVYGASLRHGTRVLAAGVLSSYAAVCHLTAILITGAMASIVDMRRGGLRALLTAMERDRIEVFRSGVSIVRAMADMDRMRVATAHLRLCWLGGEVVKPDDVPVLRAILPPDCALLNGYGATEAISFRWIVPATLPPLLTTLPIGYPDPVSEVLLLRDDGTVCARGEAGEMVTRSRMNALGEWRDGALVAGRLIPDPGKPGQRVYFSGDLARQLDDGSFVVLGRKDRMVKINGLRIEPAEIESALLASGPIADVAVLPRTIGDRTTLLAFVTPGANAPPPDPAALRAAVQRVLPAHMVPSRVIVLSEFPRLGSGKIDGVTLLREHGP